MSLHVWITLGEFEGKLHTNNTRGSANESGVGKTVMQIKPGIKSQSVSARSNFKFTAGRSAFRISTRARDLSLLQNVQTGFGAHAASCKMGTGVFTRG